MDDSESDAELGDNIDPENSWTPWAMRRREASDDEDGNSEGEDRALRTDRRAFAGLDDDLDGAGRAPEEDEVSYFDELDALGEGEEVLFQETEKNESFSQGEEERDQDTEEEKIKNDEEEQTIKEREALKVPTGAFYMHDDRFKSGKRSTSGRNSRQFKDEKKWEHDKFEEMTHQELENKRFNPCAKVQNYDRGYYIKKGRDNDVKSNRFKPIAHCDSRIVSSRIVRGRGPVKYKPLNSSIDMVPPTGNEKLRKFPGVHCKPFESSSGVYHPTRNKESRKLPGVNSNADSAKVDCKSPAYERLLYHPSSSNRNISKRRDVQSGKVEGYLQTTALPGDSTSMGDSNVYPQWKTIADSSGGDGDSSKDSTNPVFEHQYSTQSLQSSLPARTKESSQLMALARDFPFTALNAHQSPTYYNVDQVYTTNNNHALQQTAAGSIVYYPLQFYSQQLSTHSGINSEALSLSGADLRIMESFARPSESDIAWDGIGSRTGQRSGRSYQFGETHDNEIFPATRPLSPAVQLRGPYLSDGQRAVDTALDICVAQQQSGLEISGMTRMPRLPDNVGFLSPHYVTPNANHRVFSPEQESSSVIASNETNANKASKGSLTPDRTDVKNQSRNQRSKFQRYSDMKFNH